MVWNGINILGIDMDATSKRISHLIDESCLTDRRLSEIMGLSVQSINKWRHGYNLPDIENLFYLSKIFGIKIDDFLVPLVTESQPGIEMIADNESFDDLTISRVWAYFIRLNKAALLQ